LKSNQIEIDGIMIEVVRKDIKNLRMTVYPPDGRVRISVPLRVDDDSLRRVLVSKRAWIIRQQDRIRTQRISVRPKYASGESLYFQGVPYQLCVIERKGNTRVVLRGSKTIELTINPRSSAARREQAIYNWYRAYLKKAIPPLISKWEKIMGVGVSEWGVKRMRTRWGSCNTRARRIWLNLELAKRPLYCLEYVIVHEMAHLLERSHNRRFKDLMDQLMPGWRSIRKELKQN
jgi:predicted metal-dependent hydrolase